MTGMARQSRGAMMADTIRSVNTNAALLYDKNPSAVESNPFYDKKLDALSARKRAESIIKAYAQTRAELGRRMVACEEWGFGNQWGHIGKNPNTGAREFMAVPFTFTDPSSNDIFITDNRIRPSIMRDKASFALPERLPIDAEPTTETEDAYNAAKVAAALPARLVDADRSRPKISELALAMLTYPTAYLALTWRIEDDAYPVLDQQGEPSKDAAGKSVLAPAFHVGVEVIYAHQVSFDVSNTNKCLDKHQIISIGGPMTFTDVFRTYGIDLYEVSKRSGVRANLKSTWGDLVRTQNEAYASELGQLSAPDADLSQTPAIWVECAYFRHPTNERRWPTLVAFTRQIADEAGVLYFGRNPLGCCPLYRFTCSDVPRRLDGQSKPELLVQHQARINIGESQLARQEANCTAIYKSFDEGTLDTETQKAFLTNAPALLEIRAITPSTARPQILHAPPPAQGIVAELQSAIQAFEHADGASNWLRGQSDPARVATGVAQQLQTNAMAPIEDKIGDIHDEMERLFDNWVGAYGRNAPQVQIRSLLGDMFTDGQLEVFIAACKDHQSHSIRMEKNALIARNRQQRMATIESMREAGLLDDPIKRALYGEQTGIWVDQHDRASVIQAMDENRLIRAGLPTQDPTPFDAHDLMMVIHRRLFAQPHFREKYPKRFAALITHMGKRLAAKQLFERIQATHEGWLAWASGQMAGGGPTGAGTPANPEGGELSAGEQAVPGPGAEGAELVAPQTSPSGPGAAVPSGAPSGAGPEPATIGG